ncbi:ABC transporter ATP-binding protein [Lipingzhangella sp. LS1_29]|uniref:ABC transporter ATP-binding protein n=1 Tax=Lipingzhangella rawalii TaxID=2055835 RepID=A0ABU2HAG1_9ACTN|nr:ABC transporter ATP-binding protein [Lipingzhangella rawalii]MDS1272263.1 ABC transporter ATP-binding protein [Lipingzhangella rawalii]
MNDHDQMQQTVLSVNSLVKRYGDLTAVDGISLDVRAHEIVGVLGPNGAGKTSLLEMVVGLRTPTSGRIRVLDTDPASNTPELRKAVSLQAQQADIFPNLTTIEILELWASFYDQPRDPHTVLSDVGLTSSHGVRVKELSGGQARRLLVGTALIGNPQLAILDEPSSGLDPNARADLWDVITAFRDEGRTVVLSTHSMEEAEAVCDRVAIMHQGRIVALGRPGELIAEHAPYHVVSCAREPGQDLTWAAELPDALRVATVGNRVNIHTQNHQNVMEALSAAERPARDLRVRSAGLDEVFRDLTGTDLNDDAAESTQDSQRVKA